MGTDRPAQDLKASSQRQATLDRAEFAAQFRLIYSRLALIATGIIGDRAYAEDIVQEAAIIALQKLDHFTIGTSFSAWMSAIVRRCALNYARKMRNRATFASDPRSLDHSESSGRSADVEQHAVTSAGQIAPNQAEFDDDVMRALAVLGEEARCCMLLRVVLELSYNEISELLEIPKGTAMSHVHRGKATMRRALSGHERPADDDLK